MINIRLPSSCIASTICFPVCIALCNCDQKKDGEAVPILEERDFSSETTEPGQLSNAIAGQWVSPGGRLRLEISDGRITFVASAEAEEFLKRLNHVEVDVDEYMTFDIGDINYDIYWVSEEPDQMWLTLKSKQWEKLKSVELRRIRFRE
jgi:hypothetical protein